MAHGPSKRLLPLARHERGGGHPPASPGARAGRQPTRATRGFSLHLKRRNVGYTLGFVRDTLVMRLTILGLVFCLLLPMNLFAQATPPPEGALPTPTPESQKAKETEIGPSLPFTGGAKGGAT